MQSCVTLSDTGSTRSPVPPAEMPRHVPAMPGTRTAQSRRRQPTSPCLPVRVRHLPPQQFCRAACAARPKVLCAVACQGRWSVARAPVTGRTDHDKGIPGRRGGTDRIRAPRNRDPREAEAGLLAASRLDYLALRPTSSVNDAPVAVNAIGRWGAQNAKLCVMKMARGPDWRTVQGGYSRPVAGCGSRSVTGMAAPG
jgi:hypothetical protein